MIRNGEFFDDKYIAKKVASGNDDVFSLANTPVRKNSPLKDKVYYFLGSSVTYGAACGGVSMAEFLAKRNGCICYKEAVSSTTLADNGEKSYVSRLKNFDTARKINGFICQLSTNDVRLDDLGKISDTFEIGKLDKTKTFGAIEYIIAYAKKTWNCPVYFYTGSYFENENYNKMVQGLFEISKKWNITVIDLYTDKQFNDIPKEDYKIFMHDEVHPFLAGYRFWWLPKFEKALIEKL